MHSAARDMAGCNERTLFHSGATLRSKQYLSHMPCRGPVNYMAWERSMNTMKVQVCIITTPPIEQMNADLETGRSDCTTTTSWTAQTYTEKSEKAKTQESMNFNRNNGTRGTVVRVQILHGRRRNPRDRSCLFPLLLRNPPVG